MKKYKEEVSAEGYGIEAWNPQGSTAIKLTEKWVEEALGGDMDIYEVYEHLLEPLLLGMGFLQESIDELFTAPENSLDLPTDTPPSWESPNPYYCKSRRDHQRGTPK